MGALDVALGPDRRNLPRALFEERGAPPEVAFPRLGFVESTIVIVLVDLLVLAFVAIPLRYLFLGPESLALRGGVTSHAQYAREGFFQLLVAALLTLGVLWTLHWLTRRDRSGQRLAFNVLATVMVSCAVVKLISSFRRLFLSELEFGFTQDRLVAHAVTIWLGVVFMFFLAAPWTGRTRFSSAGVLAASLAFVFGLKSVDPDAVTAARNIERRTIHGKSLDGAYLGRTSTDAIPTLVARLDSLPPARQAELMTILQRKHAELVRHDGDWRSANLSRVVATQALDARFGPRSSE
ncbi:MAG: hypothetical protein KatS3mg060_2508 [Dehalococcoidia bacterium]|nr:MAG: hypothetical protein KatS3mg060_2508 [Dehalococcoidia bacterium]